MNCGLGNLTGLKRHLLAGTMQANKQFDAVIQDIGLGVAGLMEQYCNRLFARAVGDQAVFQADRASFLLPRYPVESVSQVELKLADSDDFQVQPSTFVESTSLSAGIVYLPESADGGPYWAEVRFTYTGGYFFEQLEPDDDGYPTAQPAGSKALPADLRLAWLIQCREVWNKIDKLGTGLVDKPDAQSATASLELSPLTKLSLANYRQMNPI